MKFYTNNLKLLTVEKGKDILFEPALEKMLSAVQFGIKYLTILTTDLTEVD